MKKSLSDALYDFLHDFLMNIPAWVGPAFALGLFIILRGAPYLMHPTNPSAALSQQQFYSSLSWLIPGALLLFWLMAEIKKFFNRRRLDSLHDLNDIRKMPWEDFEQLLVEVYQRKGCWVTHTGNHSGDGGIDIELTNGTDLILIQCKRWLKRNVDVKPVRELLGVVTSRKAAKGILITSGRFTRDAKNFEHRGQLELITGSGLLELIRDVQVNSNKESPQNQPPPSCPVCGSAMVMRTARKGPNPGSQFWGCSRFPNCKATQNISDE